jgi:hypothetical protein
MTDTAFGTPPPLFEEEFAAAMNAPTIEEPLVDPTETVGFSAKSAADKALSLLANKDRFKESSAQRTASLAYASLAQSDAIDRQTAVLERAAVAAERQADLTERLVAESRMANQLAFYSMNEEAFAPKGKTAPTEDEDGHALPPTIYQQIKVNLGIVAAKKAVTTAPYDEDDDTDFS